MSSVCMSFIQTYGYDCHTKLFGLVCNVTTMQTQYIVQQKLELHESEEDIDKDKHGELIRKFSHCP